MTEQATMEACEGTVKWFNAQKGYGFIRRLDMDDGPDIFVHHTAIMMDGFRTLHEGEQVRYELITGPKGLQAVNVARLV